MVRLCLIAVLIAPIPGCSEKWRVEGNGERRELLFEAMERAQPGSAVLVHISHTSWGGDEVMLSRREFRPHTFQLTLHGAGAEDSRRIPVDVEQASCVPADLCQVAVDVARETVSLHLKGKSPGEGHLVVRARLAGAKAVEDQILIRVVP